MPLPRPLRSLVSSFLLLLLTLLPSLASAQSISPTLSLDYTPRSSSLYTSTSRYLCQPVHVLLVGLHPPFSLDAVEYPYSSSQKVLASVASNVTASTNPGNGGAVVMWMPGGEVKGRKVVLRATDALGNQAWTVMRRVKDGNRKECTDLTPKWIDDNWPWVAIFILVVLLLLAWAFDVVVAVRKIRREVRDARAAGEVPLVQRY